MSRFPDVEGHLFQDDIDALDARGLVGVEAGDDYRPDDPITRGESAAYLNRVLNRLGDEAPTEPPAEPPVEPPVEPPPTGMFIPGYNGPILGPGPDATTITSKNYGENLGTIHLRNVNIRGKLTVKSGTTLVIDDFDWDGLGGNVCGHGLGGTIVASRGKVYNAEDGFKNTGILSRVWIGDLHYRDGAHGDCLQGEGTADFYVQYCNLQAYYANGQLANAALMIKTDFSPNQKAVIINSYFDGGNYTIKSNIGNAGGTPHVEVHDSLWGGNARYGHHAGPGFAVWDVTEV